MAQVVRLDNLISVYGGGHIYSLQASEIVENGSVGVAGNLLAGEREVRSFDKPSDLATDKAVLVAQEEIIYDQTRRSQNNLKDFQIESGTPFRGYELKEDDVFSVSADAITALSTDVVEGNKVVLTVGDYGFSEITDASLTTERFVGRIEAVEQVGTTTVTGAPGVIGGIIDFIVIRVEKN
ncbi:hypothetical protein [Aquibacillus saliphilus]|uniref:hypothetical protein n=1 Tax=Aquibacillus saliphilus TaxID=1909422 RepID=UPI001CF04FC2|nr:hypothetical protein [Aquibacillus saliphilus]